MAAATANAGIIFTNLFRIKLICHELDYVEILGNVPLILSFGKSNRNLSWYHVLIHGDGGKILGTLQKFACTLVRNRNISREDP